MLNFLKNILIRQIRNDEPVPYNLLLDADPSKEAVDRYLNASKIYIASFEDDVIGVYVLYPLDALTLEIKNIAVAEEFQGKGVGTLLLEDASQVANKKGVKKLTIGTSNASTAQLHLYQKNGFEINDIKYNFFLDNYPEPIFENGIQCKHMLMLTRQL